MSFDKTSSKTWFFNPLALIYLMTLKKSEFFPTFAPQRPIHVQSAVCGLLALLFLNQAPVGVGQTLQRRSIDFGIGLANYATRDELVSPLIHSGVGIPLQFIYQYHGKQHRHTAALFGGYIFSAGSRTSDMRLALRYEYHRAVSKSAKNIKLFAGAMWNNAVSVRKTSFQVGYNSQDNFSGDLIFSLNVSLLGEYTINARKKIEVQVSSPLMGLLVRPGYSLNSPAIAKFATVNRISQLAARAAYFVSNAGGPRALKLEYQFLLYRITTPRPTATVANAVIVNYSRAF